MTRPPTRADEIRRLGSAGSANVGSGVRMTAIDMDDPNLHPDGWFVIMMPTQTGVQMMGSGRYGYWEDRPSVEFDEGWVAVTGKDDGDPIFVAPRDSVHVVHVCQGRHMQAIPFPVPQLQPEQPS